MIAMNALLAVLGLRDRFDDGLQNAPLANVSTNGGGYMPLKIALKPRERLILGGAVVRNGDIGARLTVENEVPILREHDILSHRETSTPCRRIYFAVQLMYVDEGNLAEHRKFYSSGVRGRFDDGVQRAAREREHGWGWIYAAENRIEAP